MNLADFDLELNNVGSWPAAVKILVVLIVCALVLGGGYYFDTQDQILRLQRVQRQEVELRSAFEHKQAKAANLAAYKAQMEEMQQSFGALLLQLPNKAQVAELLVDVSQTGLASGLEFELFEPKAENGKEFYAELPILLRVIGSFHEFGAFVSGLAALPRVVTIHDITIAPAQGQSAKHLVMDATAKIYKYLEKGKEQ